MFSRCQLLPCCQCSLPASQPPPTLTRSLPCIVVLADMHSERVCACCWCGFRLEPDPEGVAQDTERLPALPPLLGLTDQQLQDIAAGAALFADLLQNIVTEQQELQASERSSIDVSTTGDCLSRTGEKLEAQEQSAARMQALLRKDSALRTAACAWFIGCLSWEQYTTAAVLCWPYPTRVPTLALEIARYYEHKRH